MKSTPFADRPNRTAAPHLNVALVDPHPAVLLGLEQTLAEVQDVSIVLKADSVDALCRTLATSRIDVLVIDPTLRGRAQQTLLPHLRALQPMMQVIFYCAEPDDKFAQVCEQLLGCTCVSKAESLQKLKSVVEKVCKSVRTNPLQPLPLRPGTPLLSPGQARVIGLLASGMQLTAVADYLGLSVKTVSTHKIAAENRLEAFGTIKLLRRWQLISALGAY